MIGGRNLVWRGDRLALRSGGRAGPALEIVADETYPGMFRVRLPDGELTDMVNRTRARDAAKSILLRILNSRETGASSPPMRLNGARAA
jgi:hypothetical protein